METGCLVYGLCILAAVVCAIFGWWKAATVAAGLLILAVIVFRSDRKYKSSPHYVEPPKIVRTSIIGSDSRKKLGSALVRGAIGEAALGPVGILAGTTGKNRQTTTFLVLYDNGDKRTETVENESWRYNELVQYLEI